ncbi:MAG: hypothetical protein Q4A27_02530 [bacterium]|nr:hypothetical protein [bacterium]
MNKKVTVAIILATFLSLIGLSSSASAAESATLKANIKAEEKVLNITFSENAKLNGVDLAEAGKNKAEFLKEFFNYEFPQTTVVADEDTFLNAIGSLSKINVETTNNSVKISLSDGVESGLDGLLRFSAFIDINKITDANGDTLSKTATGDLENLGAKSTRRIRIQARATYNKAFELDHTNSELSFILAKNAQEWKIKQQAVNDDIEKEAKAAQVAKEAKASGDENQIKNSNEDVKRLTRASTIAALTIELPKPAEKVEPQKEAEKTEKATEIATSEEFKSQALQAPNTGVQRTGNFEAALAGLFATILTAASAVALKKF